MALKLSARAQLHAPRWMANHSIAQPHVAILEITIYGDSLGGPLTSCIQRRGGQFDRQNVDSNPESSVSRITLVGSTPARARRAHLSARQSHTHAPYPMYTSDQGYLYQISICRRARHTFPSANFFSLHGIINPADVQRDPILTVWVIGDAPVLLSRPVVSTCGRDPAPIPPKSLVGGRSLRSRVVVFIPILRIPYLHMYTPTPVGILRILFASSRVGMQLV